MRVDISRFDIIKKILNINVELYQVLTLELASRSKIRVYRTKVD